VRAGVGDRSGLGEGGQSKCRGQRKYISIHVGIEIVTQRA
jgi:hypothetical protein